MSLTVMASKTSQFLEELAALFPPDFHEQIRAEIPKTMRTLDRLAGEIIDVELHGVRYAKAVRDDAMGYPLMTRIHFGLIPLVQSELPGDIRQAIQAMTKRLQQSDRVEELARSVFCEAASSGLTKEAAVLRFLLYQALRLGVALACWDSPEVEATGTELELEYRAQGILDGWLCTPEASESDVQPLRGMLAEALLWIRERVCDSVFQDLNPNHHRELVEILLPAIETARSLEARDAVLLRNDYASRLGEPPLESQQIVDRHPTLFRTRAAVDTRRHRLVKRLAEGGHPREGRLVDELLAIEKEGEDG